MKTRKVTFEVDVPDSVSDDEIKDRFAELYANGPTWTGWWVSPWIKVSR